METSPGFGIDAITRLATRALRAPVALLTVVDDRRQFFKSQCGLEEPFATRRETPLSHSFCKHVVASGEPLIIEDARVHPVVRENPAITELNVIAYAGMPVRSSDGRVLGTLCVIDHRPRTWAREDLESLSDLAAAASAEVEWQEGRDRETRFRIAVETMSQGVLTMDAQSIIRSVNPALERIFGYTADELVGHSLAMLIPERLRQSHAQGVRRYLETRERNVSWKGIELPGLKKSGEEIPLEISFGEYVHEGQHFFTGILQDISSRKRAQLERDFLYEASLTLGSSLDHETTLRSLAGIAVSRIADWCGVDLLENGQIRRVAAAHADPGRQELVQELVRHSRDSGASGEVAEVIRTGESKLFSEITEAVLDTVQDPERRRILGTLGLKSAIIVPLSTGGHTIGALTLVAADSGIRYGPADLALAEELGRRAALAVDHARLFRAAEEARDQLGQQAAELERGKEHYRRLLEISPYGIFVLDRNGLFAELNAAGAHILDRSADEVVGRHFAEMVHPGDLEIATQAFGRVISGQDPRLDLELSIHQPSGERRLLSIAVTSIEEQEHITGVLGFSRDITAERRTQEALRDSEERLRLLLESVHDYGIMMLDREGRVTSWNAGSEHVTGYADHEILGRHYSTFYTPEDVEQDLPQRLLARVSREGRVESEGWRLRKDGSRFWSNVVMTPVRGTDGQLVGFARVVRDLTERHRAEEERRRNEAREELMRATERERGRLSALFEQAPAFIALFQGPEHIVQLANARYLELVGRRDILGKAIREALPEVEGQGYFELLDRVYGSGEPYIGNGARVLLGGEERSEAEERYLNFVYQPFRGPDGTVSGIFVHGVDVTDVVRAREEAEAASRAKNAFLSRMSHELRTPLNAILGFGQLLELDVGKGENRESVQQILKAGGHLLALIDEVLDIARIEAGNLSLSVEPVQIQDVLRESIALLGPAAARQGIALKVEREPDWRLVVRADRHRLKQVLLNLLSNAIKYNHPQGEVIVSCERVGEDRLRLTVSDTGWGISAEKLERLFTPFDRLGAEASAVEGVGLGLSVSKALVEAMGGNLGIRSVEGEGSCFWVELELSEEPAPPPQPAWTEPHEGGMTTDPVAEAAAVAESVLFVEDNPANIRLMERLFQRRPDVKLLTAMQGSLALELAREHKPILILLDLNLPGMSGDEILIRLRQDPQTRQIPIHMISGDATPSQVQRLLELGASGYMTKPFQIAEILALVDELVRHRRGETAPQPP